MKSTMRRVAVAGLAGSAVLTGVLAGAGIANAGTSPVHHPAKKPHTTHTNGHATGHATSHAHTGRHSHPAGHTTGHTTGHTAGATTHTYATKRAGTQLRSMAGTGTASHVVSTLGKAGTRVTVSCYTKTGTQVWYRTSAGAYVAGSALRSGHDPAAGVKHC